MKIIPLQEEHLEDAAALVSSRYKGLCEQEPLLPHRYQEVSNLVPLLQNIMQAGVPGVAAIHGGQLVGFLTSWLLPNFRGKRSVYSPEWANGADMIKSPNIYEEMYSHIAAEWVAGKFVAHYISIFANDMDAIRAWHWLGFGMISIDAVRGMKSKIKTDREVDILPASLEDINQVVELNNGLRQYMKGSPAFFIADKWDDIYLTEWIADPNKVIWLAYVNGEPAAFLRMGPANDDVSTIIYDKKTTSIYGAFTKETMRGSGIGKALLDHGLESARKSGYERCAVDFESMNLLGTRFWLRHFNPVCFSLLRYVDERVVFGKGAS